MGWRQGMGILPMFLPNNISIAYNNLLNVYQAGSADAPATYRVYGACTNPKVTKFTEVFTNSTTLSDFSSGWVGGVEDTDIYQTGNCSRKLTSLVGAQDKMQFACSLDLTSAEWITFFFYVDDVTKMDTTDNWVKFKETDGVHEFYIDYSVGNENIRNGWNYFRLLKDQFEITGAPSWDSITEIEFSIKATAGQTLNVNFGDLRLRDISHTEQKLELALSLLAGEYVDFDVQNGMVTKSDGTDVSGYLTYDSEWFFLSPRQNLFMYESDTNPLATWVMPSEVFALSWNDAML
jgi:hypothetical protein